MVEHTDRNGFVIQPLEDRTLFAGLTVIAHGIEPERMLWTQDSKSLLHSGRFSPSARYSQT